MSTVHPWPFTKTNCDLLSLISPSGQHYFEILLNLWSSVLASCVQLRPDFPASPVSLTTAWPRSMMAAAQVCLTVGVAQSVSSAVNLAFQHAPQRKLTACQTICTHCDKRKATFHGTSWSCTSHGICRLSPSFLPPHGEWLQKIYMYIYIYICMSAQYNQKKW